jgi:tyrosine-protein kinase Etk/Wzc
MSEMQNQVTSAEMSAGPQKVSMMDVLIVLAKHKKLIVGLPLLAGLIAVGVALMLPPVFRAGTTLLPPQQAQSGAAALLSQLGGAAGMMAGAGGIKNPNDVYVGMLKSRTVADRLIKRFDLLKAYEAGSLGEARERLERNTVINSGKDGLITVDVEGQDRAVVADLANAYVDELKRLTKSLAITEASQRRLFFEQQLEMSKDKLAEAEVALKGALDTRGVISVDAESRSLLETVGKLRAQISAKEIQLDSMRAFVTEKHQEFRQAQEELSSLKAELGRLENGRAPDQDKDAGPGRKAGLDNIKLLRDVKYHQMLYELLARQFEMARLEEARDSSVIQTLDPAQVPERSIKPKRTVIVLISVAIALFLAVALAFLLEVTQGLWRDRAQFEKWRIFSSYVRPNARRA